METNTQTASTATTQVLAYEFPRTDGKNPAAVAMGKLGGAKSKDSRMLIPMEKRREIARKAAQARWNKSKKVA